MTVRSGIPPRVSRTSPTRRRKVHPSSTQRLPGPRSRPRGPRPVRRHDPAYKLGDLDDLVYSSGIHGLRVMIDVTGTPKWANGNKTPNRLPRASPTSRRSPRCSPRGTTAARARNGVAVVGLERAEHRAVPRTAVLREDDRRPGQLREALQGGVRRHQGGEPVREGRDRRDVGTWPRQAAQGCQRQRRPGHLREAARQGEGPQVRRLGAPSVPDVGEPAAAAEGALPERDALDAPDFEKS